MHQTLSCVDEQKHSSLSSQKCLDIMYIIAHSDADTAIISHDHQLTPIGVISRQRPLLST